MSYYRDCARAYQEQGTDETFEADFTDRLVEAAEREGLVGDQAAFARKYEVIRAVFFMHALDWAVRSEDPGMNIGDLIQLWKKRRG